MSAWSVVRLVAGREVRVKVASKSFLIATGAMVLAVVVGGVLLNLVGTTDPFKVGLAGNAGTLAGPVQTLGGGEDEVRTSVVDDVEAGKSQVRDGTLDALVVGESGDFEVFVADHLPSALESVLTSIAQQQALGDEIGALGGDPEKIAEALRLAVPAVTELEPQERDGAKLVAASVVGILLLLSLMLTGQTVAQGVVEEKTSRVVEVLLAAVRPWHLMAGKVLGIGAVGLVQIGVVIGALVATASTLGLVEASSLNLGATAVAALGWFVVGFLTYALALAALAALVSRQEEVAAVTSPVTMVMMVPYFVGVSVGVNEPDNPLVVWMSQIPFSSPLVMPIRIAAGQVPGWQIALALGLSLALLPVLTWLAGRIYSNAVLQTGGRMKLRTALLAAPPENEN